MVAKAGHYLYGTEEERCELLNGNTSYAHFYGFFRRLSEAKRLS